MGTLTEAVVTVSAGVPITIVGAVVGMSVSVIGVVHPVTNTRRTSAASATHILFLATLFNSCCGLPISNTNEKNGP